MTGLGPTFGRGAMTNDWMDLKNSDVMLVIGGNPAENHPASFLWIDQARDKGDKLIVVDPRFTRSAATADYYAALRPGTDIVFLGGMINYAFQNKLYNEEDVKAYTNALTLVHTTDKVPADLDGFFSGFDKNSATDDQSSWQYQTEKIKVTGADGKETEATVSKLATSLDDPNSVFAQMKKHYARYTPEMVERVSCPFCNDGADSYFEDGGYRLHVCEQCQHYLRTLDARKLDTLPCLPVERVLTIGMDVAARARGYTGV